MSPLFRNSEENTENNVQNTEEAQIPEALQGWQAGQRPPMPPMGFPGGQRPQSFLGQNQSDSLNDQITEGSLTEPQTTEIREKTSILHIFFLNII